MGLSCIQKIRGDVESGGHCVNCPRYASANGLARMPILFNRSSVSNIECVVVSQDPAVGLRDLSRDHNIIEAHLAGECNGVNDSNLKHNHLPTWIRAAQEPYEIRDARKKIPVNLKRQDIMADFMYWTHAVKCIPYESDAEIIVRPPSGKSKLECAESVRGRGKDAIIRNCYENVFEREVRCILERSEASRFVIVSLGLIPYIVCRRFLRGDWLSVDLKLKDLISVHSTDDIQFNTNRGNISISHLAFYHPSFAYIHEKKKEILPKIASEYDLLFRRVQESIGGSNR